MGVKEKVTHPPFVPPIKGGIVFDSCSRRRPDLNLSNFNLPTNDTKMAKFHSFLFACFMGKCNLNSAMGHRFTQIIADKIIT